MARRQVDDLAARHVAAAKIQRELRDRTSSADLHAMRQAHQRQLDAERRTAAEALSVLEEQYTSAVEELSSQHT